MVQPVPQPLPTILPWESGRVSACGPCRSRCRVKVYLLPPSWPVWWPFLKGMPSHPNCHANCHTMLFLPTLFAMLPRGCLCGGCYYCWLYPHLISCSCVSCWPLVGLCAPLGLPQLRKPPVHHHSWLRCETHPHQSWSPQRVHSSKDGQKTTF